MSGQFVQSLPDSSSFVVSEILNGDSRVLFGPDSTNDRSSVFIVLNKPYTIRAFNLIQGESVIIEMVAGEGSGTYYAPAVTPDGQPIILTSARPSHNIFVSGRYRARLIGRVGEVYVDAYPSDLMRNSKYSTNYGT
jgi:hypothetical protein